MKDSRCRDFTAQSDWLPNKIPRPIRLFSRLMLRRSCALAEWRRRRDFFLRESWRWERGCAGARFRRYHSRAKKLRGPHGSHTHSKTHACLSFSPLVAVG